MFEYFLNIKFYDTCYQIFTFYLSTGFKPWTRIDHIMLDNKKKLLNNYIHPVRPVFQKSKCLLNTNSPSDITCVTMATNRQHRRNIGANIFLPEDFFLIIIGKIWNVWVKPLLCFIYHFELYVSFGNSILVRYMIICQLLFIPSLEDPQKTFFFVNYWVWFCYFADFFIKFIFLCSKKIGCP